MASFIGYLVALPFVVAVMLPFIVLSMVYHAWAASILWEWFVTPAFGMSVPSFITFMGVSLIISLYRPLGTQYKSLEKDWKASMITALSMPLIILSIGYVLKALF